MADTTEEPEESATSKADAMAMIEQAEAEAAEAEALAAAARARARAARLRREALALAEGAEDYGDAAARAADVEAADDFDETPAGDDERLEENYAADYQEDDDGDVAEAADDDYGDDYDETSADEREGEARRGRWVPSLSAISKVAALILVVCFAAASAYIVAQHRDATQRQKRQSAFVAGAKQGITSMISLDFSKAKEDVQRVIDSSTGQFKDDFQARANDFISVVEQSKAITEGTVNAAAVESVEENSAVVLVSATSRVINSPPGKDEPPKIWRLKVTVADVAGQYKMSKVEYVA